MAVCNGQICFKKAECSLQYARDVKDTISMLNVIFMYVLIVLYILY